MLHFEGPTQEGDYTRVLWFKCYCDPLLGLELSNHTLGKRFNLICIDILICTVFFSVKVNLSLNIIWNIKKTVKRFRHQLT